jgi:hypothetical protein
VFVLVVKLALRAARPCYRQGWKRIPPASIACVAPIVYLENYVATAPDQSMIGSICLARFHWPELSRQCAWRPLVALTDDTNKVPI